MERDPRIPQTIKVWQAGVLMCMIGAVGSYLSDPINQFESDLINRVESLLKAAYDEAFLIAEEEKAKCQTQET